MYRLPSSLLVTGPSGSGKTTLVNYLNGIGVPAADADVVPDLAVWRNEAGEVVPYPANADRAWFRAHTYTWEPEVMRRYLEEHGPMVIAGLSDDDPRALREVFPWQFYLQISPEVLDQRLSERNSGFGVTPELRSGAMLHLVSSLERARDSGLIILDGTLSAEQVWQTIQSYINANAA